MLPAPIVLPRIHFPDWVGIEVRDVLVFAPFARASAAACMTGGMAAGPVLFATAVGPAISLCVWVDRVLLRRWTPLESVPRETGGGRSLLELRLG